MYPAWYGQKPFEKPLRDWRVIGITTPVMANHVVALAKSNIKTASDLKGKIFAIGAPGSAAAAGMSLFLEHTGLKKEIDARMLAHQDYPEMLLDGKIDAFNRSGSIPVAVIDEISVQKKVALVDFGQELGKSDFLLKYPYFQKTLVKGGTYKDETRDVVFFGNAGFFIVHKGVPEDLVYEFTKLAYSEETIKFVAMAFKGQNLNRKDPFEGSIGPVHPGAARFWKEAGIQVPEPVLK
jgi:TRAP transporter TAXI family solute receptor